MDACLSRDPAGLTAERRVVLSIPRVLREQEKGSRKHFASLRPWFAPVADHGYYFNKSSILQIYGNGKHFFKRNNYITFSPSILCRANIDQVIYIKITNHR